MPGAFIVGNSSPLKSVATVDDDVDVTDD